MSSILFMSNMSKHGLLGESLDSFTPFNFNLFVGHAPIVAF
jgi:hypothetical protein